jgi:glycosyltransferase involved in cell wall biosynthesis
VKLHDLVSFVIAQIAQFRPTHVLFSDPITLKATTTRPALDDASIVYMIHCAEQMPFGPFAGGLPGSSRSQAELSLLSKVDRIWSVSKAISNYAKEHGQLDTTPLVHHIWTYMDESHGIPPPLNNWEKDVVGMINPSSVKGIDILIGVAKALPRFRFVVWRSWAAEEKKMKELEQIKNVE